MKKNLKVYKIVEIGFDDACANADFLPIGEIGFAENIVVKENGYTTCHFHFDKPFKFFQDDETGTSRICFWDVKIEEVK